MSDPYLLHEAEIVERIQNAPDVFTLRLRFTDKEIHNSFCFWPGQFNMVYLFGVGEVAISIVSDPTDASLYDHTIRVVGRITAGLAELKQGEALGIRGPYGRGWPLHFAQNKDVVFITGGLGCAPVVSVINYIMNRRDQYQKIKILQGVKHSKDLIHREYYAHWQKEPDAEVLFAADKIDRTKGPWYQGYVTDLIEHIDLNPEKTICMMCGPELMMVSAVKAFIKKGIEEQNIFLSMERNMECAIRQCGHCQYGGKFICKDGPVFSYPEVKELLAKEGF